MSKNKKTKKKSNNKLLNFIVLLVVMSFLDGLVNQAQAAWKNFTNPDPITIRWGPTPTPSPTPTPTPTPTNFQQLIETGLKSFPGNPPMATLSGELSQAGQGLGGKADPLLPTIIGLMESRGLLNPQPAAAANPFNIMQNGVPVDYGGKPADAIIGGNGHQGLAGIMKPGGIYNDYLQSGNLGDFFSHFTPPSDPRNPSQEELIQRYNDLKQQYFTPQLTYSK